MHMVLLQTGPSNNSSPATLFAVKWTSEGGGLGRESPWGVELTLKALQISQVVAN